jgi:peptidoglycan hydrolase CwlO-like protein
MHAEVWVPVVVASVVGIFGIIQTILGRREMRPVRDVLQKTKIEGNGSLVEALGALSKEYKDSQLRHAEEIKYFVEQLAEVRRELVAARKQIDDKEAEIEALMKQVKSHEERLNESHVGTGK